MQFYLVLKEMQKKRTVTYSLEVRFGTGSVIDREWKFIDLDGGEDLIVGIAKKLSALSSIQ